jgi:hypothetical protein
MNFDVFRDDIKDCNLLEKKVNIKKIIKKFNNKNVIEISQGDNNS